MTWRALLAAVAVPASALTLEITETSLMSDPDGSIVALQRLRDLGVKLSVDDLGTGYSSLAYLQRLPVDEVKIDRSFLTDFTDPQARAVVQTIIDLGHGLGHKVVAEGIEDEPTFLALRELACDTAQGFWLGRPLPLADVTALVENGDCRDAAAAKRPITVSRRPTSRRRPRVAAPWTSPARLGAALVLAAGSVGNLVGEVEQLLHPSHEVAGRQVGLGQHLVERRALGPAVRRPGEARGRARAGSPACARAPARRGLPTATPCRPSTCLTRPPGQPR